MPGVFNLSIDEALSKRPKPAPRSASAACCSSACPSNKDELGTGAYARRRHRPAGPARPQIQPRLEKAGPHRRRLPLRVHQPRPLRHRRRRRPGDGLRRSRTTPPSICSPAPPSRLAAGRSRHRRPQRHDGRPRRRHPRALDARRLRRTRPSSATPPSSPPPSTGPSAKPPTPPPSSATAEAYQMDGANLREAMREIDLDLDEGADMILMKPAMPYLDVIRAARERVDVPIGAYQVSGEYSMLQAAFARGLARPRPRHPRIAARHPPRRRRLHRHLLRQGRRPRTGVSPLSEDRLTMSGGRKCPPTSPPKPSSSSARSPATTTANGSLRAKPPTTATSKPPCSRSSRRSTNRSSDFAPHHVRPAHKTMMRIYRDTRFDASRGTPPRPYKTNVAAWWSRAGLEKTSGAGFYFHFSPTETIIAAGIYMPTPDQLLAIRRHIVTHHAELRDLLANRKLRAAMPEFEGRRLTRAPRGFPADSPALDLLLCRQWGVAATLAAQNVLLFPRCSRTSSPASLWPRRWCTSSTPPCCPPRPREVR